MIRTWRFALIAATAIASAAAHGQERAAAAEPDLAKAQQINFFDLRGGAVVTDLPGYGYAAVPRALKEGWQDFLWRYITTRDTLIGLVLIVDARHGLRTLDRELLAGFVPSGRPLLVLATKSDKLNVSARRAAAVAIVEQLRDAFGERADAMRVVTFSAASGEGVPEADAILLEWLA